MRHARSRDADRRPSRSRTRSGPLPRARGCERRRHRARSRRRASPERFPCRAKRRALRTRSVSTGRSSRRTGARRLSRDRMRNLRVVFLDQVGGRPGARSKRSRPFSAACRAISRRRSSSSKTGRSRIACAAYGLPGRGRGDSRLRRHAPRANGCRYAAALELAPVALARRAHLCGRGAPIFSTPIR